MFSSVGNNNYLNSSIVMVEELSSGVKGQPTWQLSLTASNQLANLKNPEAKKQFESLVNNFGSTIEGHQDASQKIEAAIHYFATKGNCGTQGVGDDGSRGSAGRNQTMHTLKADLTRLKLINNEAFYSTIALKELEQLKNNYKERLGVSELKFQLTGDSTSLKSHDGGPFVLSNGEISEKVFTDGLDRSSQIALLLDSAAGVAVQDMLDTLQPTPINDTDFMASLKHELMLVTLKTIPKLGYTFKAEDPPPPADVPSSYGGEPEYKKGPINISHRPNFPQDVKKSTMKVSTSTLEPPLKKANETATEMETATLEPVLKQETAVLASPPPKKGVPVLLHGRKELSPEALKQALINDQRDFSFDKGETVPNSPSGIGKTDSLFRSAILNTSEQANTPNKFGADSAFSRGVKYFGHNVGSVKDHVTLTTGVGQDKYSERRPSVKQVGGSGLPFEGNIGKSIHKSLKDFKKVPQGKVVLTVDGSHMNPVNTAQNIATPTNFGSPQNKTKG